MILYNLGEQAELECWHCWRDLHSGLGGSSEYRNRLLLQYLNKRHAIFRLLDGNSGYFSGCWMENAESSKHSKRRYLVSESQRKFMGCWLDTACYYGSTVTNQYPSVRRFYKKWVNSVFQNTGWNCSLLWISRREFYRRCSDPICNVSRGFQATEDYRYLGIIPKHKRRRYRCGADNRYTIIFRRLH